MRGAILGVKEAADIPTFGPLDGNSFGWLVKAFRARWFVHVYKQPIAILQLQQLNTVKGSSRFHFSPIHDRVKLDGFSLSVPSCSHFVCVANFSPLTDSDKPRLRTKKTKCIVCNACLLTVPRRQGGTRIVHYPPYAASCPGMRHRRSLEQTALTRRRSRTLRRL